MRIQVRAQVTFTSGSLGLTNLVLPSVREDQTYTQPPES